MKWPWWHPKEEPVIARGPGLTTPTTAEEKAASDKVLAEIHDISVLMVRTELLLREQSQDLAAHRRATERPGGYG